MNRSGESRHGLRTPRHLVRALGAGAVFGASGVPRALPPTPMSVALRQRRAAARAISAEASADRADEPAAAARNAVGSLQRGRRHARTTRSSFAIIWPASRRDRSATPIRITVKGKVATPLTLSLAELQARWTPSSIYAVNQCSGNSRGFFEPRVAGGQLANGAMGNAKWRGVPLKTVLAQAGVQDGARQVKFDGLDAPPFPARPTSSRRSTSTTRWTAK